MSRDNYIGIIKDFEKGDRANHNILEKLYYDLKGRKLNRSCSACVNEMLLTLKHHFNMSQFKFKSPFAQYKNKRGDKVTISNSTMNDERAIEFLITNPERIKLFDKFPLNWKSLLNEDYEEESEEEREVRLAIEAEMQAANEGEDRSKLQKVEIASRVELEQKQLPELREMFPTIKAVAKNEFLDKVDALR